MEGLPAHPQEAIQRRRRRPTADQLAGDWTRWGGERGEPAPEVAWPPSEAVTAGRRSCGCRARVAAALRHEPWSGLGQEGASLL